MHYKNSDHSEIKTCPFNFEHICGFKSNVFLLLQILAKTKLQLLFNIKTNYRKQDTILFTSPNIKGWP